MAVVEKLATSFAQQRLWFLAQYEPDTDQYNVPLAWRVQGAIDIAALRSALAALVLRHEVLRSTYEAGDEAPLQVIHDRLPFELECLSPPAGEAWDVDAALGAALQRARLPFDLERGPVGRALLAGCAPREHVLVLVLHHIASDGWSMGVLVKELAQLYAAEVQGGQAPLEALPIQYADYAQWQRQWLDGARLQEQLQHWRHKLQGASELIELPTDKPRPAVMTQAGASVEFEWDEALAQGLRRLGQQQGTTLFMTMAALFAVLLYRHGGQDDLCIGYPVANRQHGQTQGLIGFFVNTLVLRVKLQPQHSFEQLLAQVKEDVLDADAHQDLPFEKLVEALSPQRSTNHAPLFQVMVSVLNEGGGRLQLQGLQVQPLVVPSATSKFDLALDISEQQGRLMGALEYSTQLYEEASVSRLVQRLKVLAEAVVRAPQLRLQALDVMPAAERELLLQGWNAAVQPGDDVAASTLVALIERQVRRTPDDVAVVCGDHKLSYSELDARARALACRLRAHGVGPDRLVGLCVDRSADMVVGMLAVLKAGGAYVPLDPSYPAQRLAMMVEDAAPVVLLSQRALADLLPEAAMPRVWIDDAQASMPGAAPMPSGAGAGHLAYVMYTSGSTGRPKGVQVCHGGLLRLVQSQVERLRGRGCRTMLQFASISFDMSVEEIFPALCLGARLVLRPADMVAPEAEFLALVERHRIDAMNLPTSFWSEWTHLLASGDSHVPACVRTVFVGGEKVGAESYRRWAQAVRGRDLVWVNAYGPTEATVNASAIDSLALGDEPEGEVPIGRPLPGTRLYVLDARLQLLPIGAVGELHIAGSGVARGYLNRPDLTAEKFIPDPFGEPGSRMYKSGDLARHRSDGMLEYLGRVDNQVKLRGFRIELGDVEAALRQCEGVREAVVLAREDEPGERRLVAYVVGPGGAQPAQLRRLLAQALPEYMVPAAFVALQALPLTPNGKVDRKALPAPQGGSRASLDNAYVAPATPVQQRLAEIWCEALKLDRVGVDDNFFSLGGHSLAMVRVLGRMRSRLGASVSLKFFYSHPTIRALAEQADAGAQDAPGLPPLVPGDIGARSPASFQQRHSLRRYFAEQADESYHVALGWHARQALSAAALEASLNAMAVRHEVLRTRYEEEGGEPGEEKGAKKGEVFQVVDDVPVVAFDVVDCAGMTLQDAMGLAHADLRVPFDLATQHPLRARLYRLQDGETLFVMTVHHIAADGYSVAALRDELRAGYVQHLLGQAWTGPTPSVRYRDFAAWSRSLVAGERLRACTAFWAGRLRGMPPRLELPGSRPRTSAGASRGHGLPLHFLAPLSEQIAAAAKANGVPKPVFLLACYARALAATCGRQDFVVGYASTMRLLPSLVDVVGYFNHLVPVRLVLAASDAAADLRAVAAQVYECMEFQQLNLPEIHEHLFPQRDVHSDPLFRIAFNYTNFDDRATAAAPAPAAADPLGAPVNFHSFNTRHDLGVNLGEGNGRLMGSIKFNTAVLDEATVTRFVARFEQEVRSLC